MKDKDQMNIEVLEDGTIRFDTGAFSGKNHQSAEDFLALVEEMAGGDANRSPKKDAKKAHHHHHKAHNH